MMYCFSCDKQTVVYVTADNRLVLFDAVQSSILHEFKQRDHLNASYTCIAYRKNRKRDKHYGLAALGSASGGCIVWDLSNNSHKKLAGTDAISGVAFGADGLLYTCSEKNKHVLEWDLSTETVKRKFVGGKRGVSCVCVNSSGSLMLTGGANIRLWDLKSGRKLKRFVGHALPTTLISFINEDTFVSATEDRFLSVWSLAGARTPSDDTTKVPRDRTPLATLASPAAPNGISVAMVKNSKTNARVLVNTSVDTHVWDLDVTSNDTSVLPSFSVQAQNCELKTVTELLSLDLEERVVESVEIKAFGKQDKNVELKKSAVAIEQLSNGHAKAAKKQKVTVLNGVNKMALPVVEQQSSAADERPLSERVQAMAKSLSAITNDMAQNGEDGKIQQNGGMKRKRGASLSTVLEQALQSNDAEMIEMCIAQSDAVVVSTTVQKLPISRVMPLVELLVAKYNAKPNRSTLLLVWLEAILKHHAAYLITVPDLSSSLGTLYESVKARVSVLDKFVQLSGRLDFIVSQVEIQAKGSGQEVDEDDIEDKKASLLYDEDL